jgi:ATP-dependent helicase/nuclease subunit B
MAVQFILGRSGTGKTCYCINGVVEALLEQNSTQPLVLLVPEQATYQAERAVLSDKRIGGYSRLHILSFDRLQFLLSGRNTARPALSRIGRQMAVQRILREHRDELKAFEPSADYTGLGRQMAETIAELHQYAKTPDDIEKLLCELRKDENRNLAALKFGDIALVFKEYLKFIDGKFIDPDVQLTAACRKVSKAEFLKGAKLWVDGFAGFTTSELALLTGLLKVVAEAHIALCLDCSGIDLINPGAAGIDPAGLFSTTERTYAALVEIIRGCKLKLLKPVELRKPLRFASCPRLAHIERDVFEPEPKKIPAGDNVRIISAPDARSEVRFVAGEIVRLVREKNYRYRDIAVIASDIDRYAHYVRACFDDYRLPFFIDRRKPLDQHPVVHLICSAMRTVAGGFTQSDVFTYLKTDLVPISRSDVDMLENYCVAFGVTGSDWQRDSDWNFQGEEEPQFDERRINQIRSEVIKPLLELRNGFCPSENHSDIISASEFIKATFDFLERLGIGKKIGLWLEQAVERKDYAAVEEHQQFYGRLMDVFDEFYEVFAGRQMSCQDYFAIISSAFSQLMLAFIPPRLDQVLVGSIERSRHPDLKAVFLIGASQKQFPVPVNYTGILTDDDRIAAESANFPLAPAAAQKLAERQYLAYIAFTRPSEFLYVTCPVSDEKGITAARSQFIGNLESLFENLVEEQAADEQVRIDNLHNEIELADLLCSQLGKDTSGINPKVTTGLLDCLCEDKQLAKTGSMVKSAINYDNEAVLDDEVIVELFNRQIKSSESRLSTFAACPYRHFARYILELKERKEFKLEPLDVGIFYHSVLDALLKKINETGKDFAAFEDNELLAILNEQISKIVQTNSFISNFKRHSRHNTFIIDSAVETLEECVLAVAQMVRAGEFRPILSEIPFGRPADCLGEYKILLPDGRQLFLNGKIDRLDVAEVNGEKVTVIFDYKRREKSFSWPEFYYGLDMQLAVYMLAVRNAANSQYRNAAGAFYIPVEISVEETRKAKGIFNGEFYRQLDGTVESRSSKFYNFQVSKGNGQYGDYGRSGALKPDDFEKVLKFTGWKIIELVNKILSGNIDIKPYRLGTKTECSYCEYKSVCRFDWQINDYNDLPSVGKGKVFEEMEKTGGGKKD